MNRANDMAFLEVLPDITPLLKPTTFGDFATYFFASAGGLFLGGELGKCYRIEWFLFSEPL